MDCGCSNCAALLRPLRRGSLCGLSLTYFAVPLTQHTHAVRSQGMAPSPFEGAFGNVGLIAKTRVALEASCDETWCQQTISELRLLETVLGQVQDLSSMTTSEETIRIMGLFGLAHAPSLESFLQDLEKLQPDLDRYFETGEETPDVDGPPLWATSVQRNTTTLMNNVGMQLQLTNALLRVESLRTITARNEIQQITKTSADLLPPATATNVPSQQYIMAGNENVYQGIQISGSARAHIGESYTCLGVPKASMDKFSEKLDYLASSRQADVLQSLLEEMRKKQSDSSNMLSAVDAHTLQLLAQVGQVADGSRTMLALLQETLPSNATFIAKRVNRSPSITSGGPSLPTITKVEQVHGQTRKRPRANRSTNLTLILETIHIWLSAMMMMMLLMGSRSFQRCIRSARKLTWSPSMLLGSNIMVVDALRREFSLPYEHFCR
jgi:hypothetical protein